MKQKYSELPNGYLESIDRGIRQREFYPVMRQFPV